MTGVLLLCEKVQDLVHKSVQVLYFLAIHTCRPLYHQCGCNWTQSHVSPTLAEVAKDLALPLSLIHFNSHGEVDLHVVR
jgi:hypothetical protein